MSAKVEGTPYHVDGRNGGLDWEWRDNAVYQYVARNYEWPSREDLEVANGVIARIAMLPPSYFGSLGSLRDVGTGGVLRTAALAEPLLREEAKVFLTDNSEEQLMATRAMVDGVILGAYARKVWAGHEARMAEKDSRWLFAVRRICRRADSKAVVRQQNLWELPSESTDVATEGHTLCSSTGNEGEYTEGVAAFYRQVTPGGLALRLYMIGSTGYKVGDTLYPARSITPDDVEREAKLMNMQVVGGAFGVKANPQGHGGARDKDDPTSYAGFGGAVLLKPRRPSSTVVDLK